MRDMTVVKFFLVENPDTRVAYVRDSRGFKKGVVVGIDSEHIGWSLINKEDYVGAFMRYDQFPKIQREIHLNGADSITLADMLNDIEYKKLNENGGFTRIPLFDRDEGLHIAVNRALKGAVVTSNVNENLMQYINTISPADVIEEFLAFGSEENIPNDEELRIAICEMAKVMMARDMSE